ncbi:uncharacterized protein LOC112035402 [Quercus suber]|uniref:uncharacterized protein LOC112035402 n=1 Tax=Quercus suber TaxID=58331 RepID=UPI000CE18DAE|nr:uncharacterized protein LOC112035402 [Quercus suber]
MEEMKDSMRRANHVDNLVHKTDSPFIASIMSHRLPSKFKMPTLDSYDRTHDPCDHIAMFKTTMHLQGVLDKITLKGLVRVWFGGQGQKRSSSSLLNIEQGENKSLCTFISHFNREALLVEEMDDKILLAVFYNSVNSDLFIHKLYDQKLQTMAELIHSAQNFMNTEDGYIHHPEQGPRPKKAKVGEKRDRDGKKAGSSLGGYSNYTPLNTLLDQVLMQIKDDPSLKWLERMKGDSCKWNKSKYCRFHCDHGHDTDECYDLKQ